MEVFLMTYRTITRSLFSIFALSLGITTSVWAQQPNAAGAQSAPSAAQLKAMKHQLKKNHYFFDLIVRGGLATGMQSYTSADEQGHPNPLLHAVGETASHIADISITDLATKALYRYTPLGVLKKQSLPLGPLVFTGKSIVKSTISGAKVGVLNAAYFRKKYGSLWMLHFGRNYFVPIVAKSVILAAVAPHVFGFEVHGYGLNKLMAWGEGAWWKYEIAAMAMMYAQSGLSSVYDYVTSSLQVQK